MLTVLLLLPGLAGAAEKPRLAVMDLMAKSGIQQAQLDVLGDMLATEIRMLGMHEVITKSDIQSMIGLERSKELLACDDASCIAEIGGALGVQLMVTGNVGKFGTVYAVNLKLIDVRAAKVENSVFRKVPGGEQALLDDFPVAVRMLLGVGGAPAPRPAQPFQPARPSQPAYSGPSGAPGMMELGFTKEQIQRIHGSGVRITQDAPETARRLIARGFTTEDITELICAQRLLDYPPKDGELYGLYYLAGLPPKPKNFKIFLKSRMSLTDYYNKEQEGLGLEISKWVLFGMGLLFGALGGAYVGLAAGEEDSGDALGMGETYRAMGYAFLGIGGLMFVPSIILMIVDAANRGYVPRGFFEKANKDDIEKELGRNARRIALFLGDDPEPALIAGPWVDKDGNGGLMLGFRF